MTRYIVSNYKRAIMLGDGRSHRGCSNHVCDRCSHRCHRHHIRDGCHRVSHGNQIGHRSLDWPIHWGDWSGQRTVHWSDWRPPGIGESSDLRTFSWLRDVAQSKRKEYRREYKQEWKRGESKKLEHRFGRKVMQDKQKLRR